MFVATSSYRDMRAIFGIRQPKDVIWDIFHIEIRVADEIRIIADSNRQTRIKGDDFWARHARIDAKARLSLSFTLLNRKRALLRKLRQELVVMRGENV